jgi:RNA 3'-terminal phosphate cyclase (ATP)
METLHIDGSYGEGGGQVLRTSLALSAILGRELHITRIRAGRSKPGLAAQHVTCVRAAAAICDAEVRGDQVGSQELRFRPGKVRPGRYTFDVADVQPSAGSVSLVLQTVLPPLSLAAGPSDLTLRGGTNVPWSPPFEYIAGAFIPAVARFGVHLEVDRLRGGWYPRGGGELRVQITPTGRPLTHVTLTNRGGLIGLTAISTVSENLPDHITRRQLNAALQPLPHDVSRLARRETPRPPGGPGTCLALLAEFDSGHGGFTSLGERGKPAEKVGAEGASAFTAFLAAAGAVDVHLADQLLLYAALAEGHSALRAESGSLHLETNAWVLNQFLGPVVSLSSDDALIAVEGVGVGSI